MPPVKQKENLLVSVLCNLVAPALAMTKLSSPDRLGPMLSLALGLSFPLAYGCYDLIKRRNVNLISLLGFVSTLLTGGLGLLAANSLWFAVKEASVPLLVGIFIVASMRSRAPLVKSLLYNDSIINTVLVDSKLDAQGQKPAFQKLLERTTWLLGGSFFLSALLNFVLAIEILESPSGTPEFTAEIGKMMALSYPVIVLPCTVVTLFALWRMVHGLRKLTGLDLESLFHQR